MRKRPTLTQIQNPEKNERNVRKGAKQVWESNRRNNALSRNR